MNDRAQSHFERPLAGKHGRPQRTRLVDLFDEDQWNTLSEHFHLSCRQKEIARLICLGYSNTAIARELGIEADTVRMHNRGLFKKLDTHQRMGVLVQLVLAERTLFA